MVSITRKTVNSRTVALRLPRDVFDKLVPVAAEQERSIGAQISWIVRCYIERVSKEQSLSDKGGIGV